MILALLGTGWVVRLDFGFVSLAIFFLSSNLARRVNGHTLIVDGGTTSLFPFDMS